MNENETKRKLNEMKIVKEMALWSRVGKRSMVGANSNHENQHALTYRRKPSFYPLSPPWSRCRRRACYILLIIVILVSIFFLCEKMEVKKMKFLKRREKNQMIFGMVNRKWTVGEICLCRVAPVHNKWEMLRLWNVEEKKNETKIRRSDQWPLLRSVRYFGI